MVPSQSQSFSLHEGAHQLPQVGSVLTQQYWVSKAFCQANQHLVGTLFNCHFHPGSLITLGLAMMVDQLQIVDFLAIHFPHQIALHHNPSGSGIY